MILPNNPERLNRFIHEIFHSIAKDEELMDCIRDLVSIVIEKWEGYRKELPQPSKEDKQENNKLPHPTGVEERCICKLPDFRYAYQYLGDKNIPKEVLICIICQKYPKPYNLPIKPTPEKEEWPMNLYKDKPEKEEVKIEKLSAKDYTDFRENKIEGRIALLRKLDELVETVERLGKRGEPKEVAKWQKKMGKLQK